LLLLCGFSAIEGGQKAGLGRRLEGPGWEGKRGVHVAHRAVSPFLDPIGTQSAGV